ncbi:ABC transporter permease [Sporosarcina sp. YIM B06819]|uniref:ABC transporter permease n=1 Tax=Sporosarcina sp. YIM B06819 TaxID=3081769 RepID=UPI00298C1A69|nr:ABC transporter permease [Sporosarcina sp. YIM B06819]
MNINSIWNKRVKEFYSEIIRYFSVITMSVVYSFIIFGAVFLYYYTNFVKWMPSSFPTELLAALVVTSFFLTTGIRTFLKQADVIFLMPAEARLSTYFRKSMVYSACIHAVQLIILLMILSPLIRLNGIAMIMFPLAFSGLLLLNIRLIWVEQWLVNSFQLFTHRMIRFLLFVTILYLLFVDAWLIAGSLILVNSVLWFYVVNKKTTAVQWNFLILREEKTLEKVYKFIHLYIDVPHLTYSFKPRRQLGWSVKRAISYQQSSAYTYLFAHLFVRLNEFYYLYVRLTIIGCTMIYFVPTYGWLIIFPILFFTGYQLLPLKHTLNDYSHTYPISTAMMKKSFKTLLLSLLLLQLVLLNVTLLVHVFQIKMIGMIALEILFFYWFVCSFIAKRILTHPADR